MCARVYVCVCVYLYMYRSTPLALWAPTTGANSGLTPPRGGERERESSCVRNDSLSNVNSPYRRTYRRGFADFIQAEILALGSLSLWGNSKFYLRVTSLPGVSPKSPFGLILDSTERMYHPTPPFLRQIGLIRPAAAASCLPRRIYIYIYVCVYTYVYY